MVEDPVFIPLEGDGQLEVDGVVKLGDGEDVHQAGGHIHLHRTQLPLLCVNSEWCNVLLVVLLKHQQLAVLLIRLVSTVHYLVTPLLHADALTIIAGELLLPAAGELEQAAVGRPLVVQLETKVIRMFPKISQSRRRPLLGPSPG